MLTKKLFPVLSTIIFIFLSMPSGAGTIYVPADFNSIQAAIDYSSNGDTVVVAYGTYTGDGNRDIDFSGKSITVCSENGPNDCIIDCNGTQAEHHRAFYFHNGEQANSVVDGFTIKNGYASEGGGIYCQASSPTIKNCRFSKNCADGNDYGGGAICSVDSSPKVTNCTFDENTTYEGCGGGICNYNNHNNTVISGCTFTKNASYGLDGGCGGGIYNSQADGSLTVANCTFIENTALSSQGGSGGGMCIVSGSPTVTNCTFRENYSDRLGGGLWYVGDGTDITVTNCTFNSNYSGGGGGMSSFYNSPMIRNCLFSGNTACGENYHSGGGILDWGAGGMTTVANCTLSGNKAADDTTGFGGGISCYMQTSNITNCILYDNRALDGNEIALLAVGTTDVNYSDIKDNSVFLGDSHTLNVGPGNIDIDPCFVNPGYWDPNGSSSNPDDDFWVNGDYHLLPGSPCVNTGDPNYIAKPNERDLDGNPRVIDYIIDIGADEYRTDVLIEIVSVYEGSCIVPGDELVYNIIYSYLDKPELSDINSAYLINYLPPQTEYISSSPQADYDPAAHTLSWPLGTLRPGDSGSVSLVVEVKPCVNACTVLENTSEVKSGDTVYDNVTEQTEVCCPVLTIQSDLSENGCAAPGDIITYNICYNAEGYSDDDVVIIDELPVGLDYIFSQGGFYNHGSRTVLWNIGTLSPDGSGCIELLVEVNTSVESFGTITNHCTMTGDCMEIDASEQISVCCWSPTVIYVDKTASGADNGTSWANAYKYLQDALEDANSSAGCEQIWVAAGTYSPVKGSATNHENRKLSFRLNNGVAIYGGFPPGGGTWQTRDPDTYKTILYGDINGNDPADMNPADFMEDFIRYDNNYNVVTAKDVDETAILDGLTISGGNARESAPFNRGGGMYIFNASPTVTNCTFLQNAARLGGAIYNCSSSPRITACTFEKNGAEQGAGIYNDWTSKPVITKCNFIENSTQQDGKGGGIYNVADFVLKDCTFSENYARLGGGIYNTADITVTGCKFSENSSFNGGGLHNAPEAKPNIHACSFENNSAENNGGGIFNRSCDSIITSCVLSANRAYEQGGGIYLYSGSHNITNCTFVANRTHSRSGAIYSSDSKAKITSSIFCANRTDSYDEQIEISDGEVYFAYNYFDEYILSTVIYMPRESLVRGPGNIDDVGPYRPDPRFTAPGYWDNNDTWYMDDDVWYQGDYHLLPDSPCINTGDPDYITAPGDTDLDGLPRVIAGRVDMGAFELDTRPVAVAGPNQTAYVWIDGVADVNLDGSASYGDSNSPLDYYWSWIIDGNTYEANGISPTVKLPAGEHLIELVVNDGIDSSEPDYCTVTVIEPLRAKLWLWPATLNCKSKSYSVTTFLYLPRGVEPNDVSDEPLTMYPCDIRSKYQRVLKIGHGRYARTVVIAVFEKDQICNCLDIGWHRVDITGILNSGRYFYGTNALRITKPYHHKWPFRRFYQPQ